jgi:hypothetical protein
MKTIIILFLSLLIRLNCASQHVDIKENQLSILIAQNNPAGEFLDKIQNQAPPLEQQIRPVPIPEDQINNIERFRNSPCFQTLGYEISMSYKEQDKKYRECEDAKKMKKIIADVPNFLGSIIIILGVFVIFILSYRENQKNKN